MSSHQCGTPIPVAMEMAARKAKRERERIIRDEPLIPAIPIGAVFDLRIYEAQEETQASYYAEMGIKHPEIKHPKTAGEPLTAKERKALYDFHRNERKRADKKAYWEEYRRTHPVEQRTKQPLKPMRVVEHGLGPELRKQIERSRA
jgi:hypothetical protein